MGSYDSKWRNYRRLRLFSLLFLVPFCSIPLSKYFHFSVESPILHALLMLCGLIGLVAWVGLSHFRCPRCGKIFAISWWFNLSLFAQRCVHCGLEKFSNPD